MALAEPVKKGGRYTKKEQEERRLKVYHLHLEEKIPAVKIAELLNVNRNNVNDDIEFWYSQLGNKSGSLDYNAQMTEHFLIMKIQRGRFLEYLDEAETLDEKIRLEKLIMDIVYRLAQISSKAIDSRKENLSSPIELEDIDDEEIKKFVRSLIFSDIELNNEKLYSEDSLKFEFIHKTKRDVSYADRVIKKMHEDGLNLCEKPHEESDHIDMYPNQSKKYNLKRFASLKGYLSTKEYNTKKQQRKISKKN